KDDLVRAGLHVDELRDVALERADCAAVDLDLKPRLSVRDLDPPADAPASGPLEGRPQRTLDRFVEVALDLGSRSRSHVRRRCGDREREDTVLERIFPSLFGPW